MKTNRPCPACANSDAEIINKLKMFIPKEYNLPGEYNIVSCSKCGCCYADTTANTQDYDDYYRNHNYYGGGWKYNTSSYFDHAVMGRILRAYSSDKTLIMDLGCGNGRLIKYLDSIGFDNLIGVDPSTEAVDELTKNGFSAAVGSVYEKSDSDNKADIVIMAMVLEHLFEPQKAIINIRDNYLKEEGGYILLSWPCFDDLMIDETPLTNIFNHEHINFFSMESVDMLMHECGFERVCSHIGGGIIHERYIQLSDIALYKKSDVERSIPSKDIKTKYSINEFIARVEKNESELVKRISTLANSGKEIVIWGTGSYMMHLMAVSELAKCNIKCFVDNNKLKQRERLWGYEVKSPDCLDDFDGTVVITVMLYIDEILEQIDQIKDHGFDLVY